MPTLRGLNSIPRTECGRNSVHGHERRREHRVSGARCFIRSALYAQLIESQIKADPGKCRVALIQPFLGSVAAISPIAFRVQRSELHAETIRVLSEDSVPPQ